MTTTSIVLVTIGIALVVALVAIALIFYAVGAARADYDPYQEMMYNEAEPPDEKE